MHRIGRGSSRFRQPWHGLSLLAALLLSACATVSPPSSSPSPSIAAPLPAAVNVPGGAELRALVEAQDRLYRVGSPLLVANTELCKGNARELLGITAKNKYSYSPEYVNAAQQLYGLGEHLQVMGVLTDSGAAHAGVHRGDKLLTVEGVPLPTGENAERDTAAVLAPLMHGHSRISLTVERDGRRMTLDVPLTHACAFGFELGNTANPIAYADGHRVLVSRGMLDVVQSDDELAYVLAKEMAHNVLDHAGRLRMSATVGGIIDNLTRVHPDLGTMVGMAGVKPMPKQLDATADRLSLYLLARAGYDVDGVVPFWKRIASRYPASMLNGYTALHPATDYRIWAMNKTLALIKQKKAAGEPLLP